MPSQTSSFESTANSARRVEQQAEIDELLEDFDDSIDPIIRQFAEKMVTEAVTLAASSSRYTATEIITQAGFMQPGTLGRIKKQRKLSAWDICQREERKNVPAEMLKPKSGTGYGGRPGVNGDFLKHCQEVYRDVEKKAQYTLMAAEENAQPVDTTFDALAKKQKKILAEMKTQVSNL
jgi:hypothetical protein